MEDNVVQPFQLEASRIRGRIVRLGDTVDDILKAHSSYPESVLRLTGETLVLCSLLSSMLKYEGIFTLQTSGNGPVTMLVADMASDGAIRACAAFRQDDISEGGTDPAGLLGKGHMAFTVDQGTHAERYQGIVELKPESLIASVQHYFAQSEQIDTGIIIHVGKIDGKWRAGGIMLQQMPEDNAGHSQDKSEAHEDDWRRAMVLLSSVKEDEMLSPLLGSQALLFRLFHEEGIRVFDSISLRHACRCSAERVEGILNGMSDDDIDDMTVDGSIVMTCEFCSTDYRFNPDDFKKGSSI